jgi:hypothetical protein
LVTLTSQCSDWIAPQFSFVAYGSVLTDGQLTIHLLLETVSLKMGVRSGKHKVLEVCPSARVGVNVTIGAMILFLSKIAMSSSSLSLLLHVMRAKQNEAVYWLGKSGRKGECILVADEMRWRPLTHSSSSSIMLRVIDLESFAIPHSLMFRINHSVTSSLLLVRLFWLHSPPAQLRW